MSLDAKRAKTDDDQDKKIETIFQMLNQMNSKITDNKENNSQAASSSKPVHIALQEQLENELKDFSDDKQKELQWLRKQLKNDMRTELWTTLPLVLDRYYNLERREKQKFFKKAR